MNTKESLTAIGRSALIQLAIKNGVPSASAYSAKSVVLIDHILSKQVAPLPMEDTPPLSKASLGLFKINRKAFHSQLSAASRVVCGKASLPILNNALLEFGAGRMKVTATNLDVWITTETPAETADFAAVTVPVGCTLAFVSMCSSEYLMAEIVGQTLRISDASNKTEIMGIHADQFPASPKPATERLMTVPAKHLIKAFVDSEMSASTEALRYVLNSVALVTTKAEAPEMVATDGKRLCRIPLTGASVTPLTEKAGSRISVIPTKAVHTLIHTLPKEGWTEVMSSDRRLVFTAGNPDFLYALTTKLLDCNYPNYHQVIPKESRPSYTVTGQQFMDALNRVSVITTTGKSDAVKLTFGSGKLRIESVQKDIGSGIEPIEAKCYTKETTSQVVMISAKYLKEIVGAWKPEDFTIGVKDEVSPILLGSEGRLAVVMPVRSS